MLLSAEYQAELEECHDTNAGWGKGGIKYIDTILSLIYQGDRVLDYGCGKGHLGRELIAKHDVNCYSYDPGVPKFSRPPMLSGFDLITCTDVLEHIEPESLSAVLDHIQSLRKLPFGKVFFTIGLGPAVKVLPSGRNAHLIQEDKDWWLRTLRKAGFEVIDYEARTKVVEVLCGYKKGPGVPEPVRG